MDTFFTVAEVAEKLGSTPRTVCQLIKDGQLKAYYKLRKYFILEKDLLDYLKR